MQLVVFGVFPYPLGVPSPTTPTANSAVHQRVVADLVPQLRGVPWDTPKLSAVWNSYLLALGRRSAAAVGCRLLPGVLSQDPGGEQAAWTLGVTLRTVSPRQREIMIREAWRRANNKAPPTSVAAYHHPGGIAIQAVLGEILNGRGPKW